MKEKRTRRTRSKSLTTEQKKELAAQAVLPDDKIDTREMPEVRDWSNAKRGLFFRPMKQQLTLRLDADVVAWFKEPAPKGYQTDINRALREQWSAARVEREAEAAMPL